jgi:hypothetical protein
MLAASMAILGALMGIGGVIVGQRMARATDHEKFIRDTRKEEFQSVLAAITSAYSLIVRASVPMMLSGPEMKVRDDTERTSYETIRNCLYIVDDLKRLNILDRWFNATKDADNKGIEESGFFTRYNAINADLVRAANDNLKHHKNGLKRLRLNGWQRVGIVASILWAFGGGLWGNNIGIRQGDWAVEIEKDCMADGKTDWRVCDDNFDKEWNSAISSHWDDAAFIGLVPIPFAWGIAYGVRGIVRWIRKGFKPSEAGIP